MPSSSRSGRTSASGAGEKPKSVNTSRKDTAPFAPLRANPTGHNAAPGKQGIKRKRPFHYTAEEIAFYEREAKNRDICRGTRDGTLALRLWRDRFFDFWQYRKGPSFKEHVPTTHDIITFLNCLPAQMKRVGEGPYLTAKTIKAAMIDVRDAILLTWECDFDPSLDFRIQCAISDMVDGGIISRFGNDVSLPLFDYEDAVEDLDVSVTAPSTSRRKTLTRTGRSPAAVPAPLPKQEDGTTTIVTSISNEIDTNYELGDGSPPAASCGSDRSANRQYRKESRDDMSTGDRQLPPRNDSRGALREPTSSQQLTPGEFLDTITRKACINEEVQYLGSNEKQSLLCLDASKKEDMVSLACKGERGLKVINAIGTLLEIDYQTSEIYSDLWFNPWKD